MPYPHRLPTRRGATLNKEMKSLVRGSVRGSRLKPTDTLTRPNTQTAPDQLSAVMAPRIHSLRIVRVQGLCENVVTITDDLRWKLEGESLCLLDKARDTRLVIDAINVKDAWIRHVDDTGCIKINIDKPKEPIDGRYRGEPFRFCGFVLRFGSNLTHDQFCRLEKWVYKIHMRTVGIDPISAEDFYGSAKPRTYMKARLRKSDDLKPVRYFDETDSDGDIDSSATEKVPTADQIILRPNLDYHFHNGKSMVFTNNDFQCLYNDNWVNDTVVDFFIQYYYSEGSKNGTLDNRQIEIFNSFFFTQLGRNGTPPEKCFDNVRNWFKNNDTLFDKDYIVIPVITELHWFLVIIGGLKELRESKTKPVLTELAAEREKIPKETGLLSSQRKGTPEAKDRTFTTIYVLDSLRKDNRELLPYLRQFLIDYADEKYGLKLEAADFRRRNCRTPMQKNFNDCGLHLIYNASLFFQKPSDFERDVLTFRKHKGPWVLYNLSDIAEMRPKLRHLLIGLLKDQVKRDGGDESEVGMLTNGMAQEGGLVIQDEIPETVEDDDDIMILEERVVEPVNAEEPEPKKPTEATSPDGKSRLETLERSLKRAKANRNSKASNLTLSSGKSSLEEVKVVTVISDEPKRRIDASATPQKRNIEEVSSSDEAEISITKVSPLPFKVVGTSPVSTTRVYSRKR